MTSSVSEDDHEFANRIQRSIETVKAWDADAALLEQVRTSLPWHELRCAYGTSKYDDSERKDDGNRLRGGSTGRFVQRLCRYFQRDVMTWVNQPGCRQCNKNNINNNNMSSKGTRQALSDEEIAGEASRVEVYQCNSCNTTTDFPRFNSVRTLLHTRKGRCGEYANLFGLYCRAVGLETRYIADWTDHVWVEVYCVPQQCWIMADSCEGVVDEPSMYEAGWGKQLSYAVGIAADHVIDVSAKYTRQWSTGDFQARRRAITSSEDIAQQIIYSINQTLWSSKPARVEEEWERRLAFEEMEMKACRATNKWSAEYMSGRISGSLEWKMSRQEAGQARTLNDEATGASKMNVESFFPLRSDVSIQVTPFPSIRHESIRISGAPCAVGGPNTISAVVVDETCLGCILQSRSFGSLKALTSFIKSIPRYRIVVIHGRLRDGAVEDDETHLQELNRELGQLDLAHIKKGIVFVGQVSAKPDWSVCRSFEDVDGSIMLHATRNLSPLNDLQLRTERNAQAASVCGRIPESIMPLATQLLATHEQKRISFLSYLRQQEGKDSWKRISGYITKAGSPVYLLGEQSYPFERVERWPTADQNNEWTSFLLLPRSLVDPGDKGIIEVVPSMKIPTYEVPIEISFFVENVGPLLLHNVNQSPIETSLALRNSRLVAFYFSAHWCGPCRAFTPMLAEIYSTLKEEYPTHGLEIVFVSSDRDPGSFQRYYGSMPWLAIPFDALPRVKPLLAQKYGVRGIPSLVVLDAVSGQIVAPGSSSRSEISRACQSGDTGITSLLQSWLTRVPDDTKEIIAMLELSCAVHASTPNPSENRFNEYLVRNDSDAAPTSTRDLQSRVKAKFAEYVQQGMSANEAAAKAIEVSTTFKFDADPGPLNGKFKHVSVPSPEELLQQSIDYILAQENGRANLEVILSTVLKYLKNIQKEPWTPLYRIFKLSNKVADRIARVDGGIDVLLRLGIEICNASTAAQDFIAYFPVDMDLDKAYRTTSELLETHGR